MRSDIANLLLSYHYRKIWVVYFVDMNKEVLNSFICLLNFIFVTVTVRSLFLYRSNWHKLRWILKQRFNWRQVYFTCKGTFRRVVHFFMIVQIFPDYHPFLWQIPSHQGMGGLLKCLPTYIVVQCWTKSSFLLSFLTLPHYVQWFIYGQEFGQVQVWICVLLKRVAPRHSQGILN